MLSHFCGQSIVLIGFDEVFVRTTCSEIALEVLIVGFVPYIEIAFWNAGLLIILST